MSGSTLDEIGELLLLDATENRARAKALAKKRLAALDRKIVELKATRSALRHLYLACGVGCRALPDHRRIRPRCACIAVKPKTQSEMHQFQHEACFSRGLPPRHVRHAEPRPCVPDPRPHRKTASR